MDDDLLSKDEDWQRIQWKLYAFFVLVLLVVGGTFLYLYLNYDEPQVDKEPGILYIHYINGDSNSLNKYYITLYLDDGNTCDTQGEGEIYTCTYIIEGHTAIITRDDTGETFDIIIPDSKIGKINKKIEKTRDKS
jgi:hypothetical protein